MGLYPKAQTVTVPMSFESGFQTTVTVPFAGQVEILSVSAQVTKALANTDAGTIAIKDNDDNVLDTLSFPLSSALAVTDTSSFADRVFVQRDEVLKLTSDKSTAGGEALVTIEYQPIPHHSF